MTTINNIEYMAGYDVVKYLGYDIGKNSYVKYIKRYCDEEDYMLVDSKTRVQNELACKLYESDVKALLNETYGLVNL